MPKAEAAEESALPFEAALARLEEVVDRLEQGDLELEASLAAFEEGVRLSPEMVQAWAEYREQNRIRPRKPIKFY